MHLACFNGIGELFDMSFLTFGLAQTLTLWRVTGIDGFNKPSFAAPEEQICRWEERSEKIQTADGTEVLSRARIFLAVDVALGDYMLLGTNSETNPMQVPGAYRVRDFRKIPSLDGTMFERKAFL